MTDPAAYFSRIAARRRRCFWLDGGGAREWSGRRSMIGWLDADDVSLTYDAVSGEVLRHAAGRAEVVAGDVFTALAAEVDAGSPHDHWVGYFGYAARPDLPALGSSLPSQISPADRGNLPKSPTSRDDRQVSPADRGIRRRLPDAVWMRAREVRFFTHPPPSPELSPHVAAPTRTQTPDPDYRRSFDRVLEELLAGNSYEVNLTYRMRVPSSIPPLAAYLRLRELNPAPYAGFLQHDLPGHRAWLLSSSPERFALVTEDRTIQTKPIKGTTPRGPTPAEDAAARDRLATGEKFRSENLMIVDLLRNDLSMVCRPGTVEVPALMQVESYPAVHQLVSTVSGRLTETISTVEALRALFPAGSMTGAPKRRTMQIIADVESTPRGIYSGAFGWIAGDGRADLGVVIRSLTTSGDGVYELGTGGGITVRSDVTEEYAESRWKAERLLRVFGH